MDTTIKATPASTDVLKVIRERRAIRKYKNRPVDHTLIEQVIQAGKMAPSAMNTQSWHFYVLTDPRIIATISGEISGKVMKHIIKEGLHDLPKVVGGIFHFVTHGDWMQLKDPIFHSAPVVVFITAPVNYEWAALDTGMCAQNMLLAAKALGLDACPIGIGKYVSQTKSYHILHVPANEQVLLAIILGYGDETPSPHDILKGNVFYVD